MPSGNQSGNQSGNEFGDKSGNKLGAAPRHVPTLGETTDADIKSEYLEAIPYKPCPANVNSEWTAGVSWSPRKSISSPIHLSEVMGIAKCEKGGRG